MIIRGIIVARFTRTLTERYFRSGVLNSLGLIKNLKQILIFAVIAVLIYAATSHEVNASTTITGTATKCTSTTNCSYTIKTSSGTGSANTTYNSISFKLPSELKSSKGPYSPYIVHQTCCYIYHMAGSFTVTDANNGKVVTGTTNTFIRATVHCQRGCTTTWALINGTITFNPTNQDPTGTTVTCNPSNIVPGGSSTCTVKVTDLSFPSSIPTGTVNFSTSSAFATFNKAVCTLSAGGCSVTFTAGDEDSGGIAIYTVYNGNSNYYKSSASTSVYVTAPP